MKSMYVSLKAWPTATGGGGTGVGRKAEKHRYRCEEAAEGWRRNTSWKKSPDEKRLHAEKIITKRT